VFLGLLLTGLVILTSEFLITREALKDSRLSHDRLRTALLSGNSVVWDLDVKAGTDKLFGDLKTMFGISSESFTWEKGDFYRHVHPEDRQRVAEAVAHSQASHAPYTAEFRVLHEDGTVRWVSACGEFQYSNKGDAVRMLGVAVDITEHRRVQESLMASQAKFAKAFRASPVAITLTSALDHRYIEVNETFERATGWSRDEVIGRTPFEINSWVDPSQREQLANNILEQKSFRDVEVRYRRKDGSQGVALGSGELIEIEGEPCILSAIVDITDRKHAEEALRQKEQDLADAQRLGHIGSWECDAEGSNMKWSDELYRIYGLDPSQPAPTFDKLQNLYTHETWNRMLHAMKTRTVSEMDTELVHEDGTTRWIRTRFDVTREADGTIVKFRGISRDITEEKQTGDRLRESEERFRRVVDHIGEAVFVDDVEGRAVFANDRFLSLFGFRRQQLPSLRLDDLVAPEYRSAIRDRHNRRMRGESVPTNFEYQAIKVDGSRMWLEVDVVPIVDQEGKTTGTQSVLRDITERKRAEQVLRESEERFRLVANTAPVMIWMAGTDKLCNYFNRPWLDFTGGSLESQLGDGWLKWVHPEDASKCFQTYVSAFDQRKSFEMQCRLRRHTGEYGWVLDFGVPRFNADGSFAGYIGSCIDITERKQAEETLATVGRRLIEAHEEERTWIGRELHDDVNQRLALLSVELDRWLKDNRSKAPIRELIHHTQERITEIATDVQSLSHRLHSSKLEYLGLARAANSFCRELSQKSSVEVTFTEERVPRMLPEEISLCLFRVLQEALQNAVKHSGVKAFTVKLRGSDDSIELIVEDRGSGFDPAEAFKSQGIGLISMRERLQLVHGELSVQSKPGGGTKIHAHVPLLESASRAMAG
jgi:PAS domain S-box-containing protein